jgi:hypothetical protein
MIMIILFESKQKINITETKIVVSNKISNAKSTLSKSSL